MPYEEWVTGNGSQLLLYSHGPAAEVLESSYHHEWVHDLSDADANSQV